MSSTPPPSGETNPLGATILPEVPVALYAPTIPAGLIIMWTGHGPIPAGWLLCDGTHGTPDLRDRFPCGVPTTGSIRVKGMQPAQHITLAAEHLPSHSHKAHLPIPDAHYSTWGRGDGSKTETGRTLHPTELDAGLMHPQTYTTRVKAGDDTTVYDRRAQDEIRSLQQVLNKLNIEVDSTGTAQPVAVPSPARTYVHFLQKS